MPLIDLDSPPPSTDDVRPPRRRTRLLAAALILPTLALAGEPVTPPAIDPARYCAELPAEGGSLVVLDPDTGEMLLTVDCPAR